MPCDLAARCGSPSHAHCDSQGQSRTLQPASYPVPRAFVVSISVVLSALSAASIGPTPTRPEPTVRERLAFGSPRTQRNRTGVPALFDVSIIDREGCRVTSAAGIGRARAGRRANRPLRVVVGRGGVDGVAANYQRKWKATRGAKARPCAIGRAGETPLTSEARRLAPATQPSDSRDRRRFCRVGCKSAGGRGDWAGGGRAVKPSHTTQHDRPAPQRHSSRTL